MDQTNTNQHYISDVLLKRFRIGSSRLQCFQVQTGKWVGRSTRDACSATGYNQLLINGKADHSIENELSKIESKLPATFKCLESIAKSGDNRLPDAIHQNIVNYCSYLKLISPIAKPGALVSFMMHINMELEKEHYDLLPKFGVTQEAILQLRSLYIKGGRVIFDAENLMQQLFRFQFSWLLPTTLGEFQNTMWAICNSPIEMPMSDVGLIPIHLPDLNANQFILPIGQKLVLEGIFYFDQSKNVSPSLLRKIDYTVAEAQQKFDYICASALEEIICARKIPDIPTCIARARENGISFQKIVNPSLAMNAGLTNADPSFGLRVVSIEEYVKFVHQFIKPPNLIT